MLHCKTLREMKPMNLSPYEVFKVLLFILPGNNEIDQLRKL